MKDVIILYQSKYGATRKYAQWLSGELKCELTETKNAKISEIEKYNTVILGGGIYAGGIAGLSLIKKHYAKLKDKKIIVFAVGASPYDEKAMIALKSHNFKNDIANIPLFYCRGAWNESDVNLKDRMLCNMLKMAVAKKDPATYEPWEKALVEAIGSNCDWTDKENLLPILEYVQAKK